MKIIKPNISKELDTVEDLLKLIRDAKEDELDIETKQINNISFADIVFKSCDLSNSSCNGAYFNRCELVSCKGIGIALQNVTLKEVSFLNSHFKYANFDMALLKNVSMIGSDLSHANISECRLSNFKSKKSIFTGVSFFKTLLKGVDFSESDINGISVSSEELKGLIVNPVQAVELSKILGLIIK